MSDHEDNRERLAGYGLGVARLYLLFWICIAYFWAICGVVFGLLIVNDGSKVFGFGMIAVGLIAWKIAGRLRRFKKQGE